MKSNNKSSLDNLVSAAKTSNRSQKKTLQKKATSKKKTTTVKTKKKDKGRAKSILNTIKWLSITVFLVGVGIYLGFNFKHGWEYFFQNKKSQDNSVTVFDIRNAEVIHRHQNHLVGFDVSHYQGHIAWDKVDSVQGVKPLSFVFIRATMGEQAKDKAFDVNWKGASANHFIKGAYHYYRPNENSIAQANNFISNVRLSPGDLPPVLDIEELPKNQSIDSLVLGLKRWSSAIEKHYKVKPILYSGEHYYTKHLKKWFPDHILWIANYNFFVEQIKPTWHFWQFSEKGTVKGIDTKVDLNIYQGNKTDIRKILIK